jgi:penicillin V acylase-like amidase (Ntn superfamily)
MTRHRVLDFHWEGDDLYASFEDGRQVIYKNCIMVSSSDPDFPEPFNTTGFIEVKFSFDYTRVKSK